MLLFLLLTCTGPGMVMAQSFRVGNIHHSLELTAFDTETGTVYTFWKDSLRVWEGPDYQSPKELQLKGEPENFPIAWFREAPIPVYPSHAGIAGVFLHLSWSHTEP